MFALSLALMSAQASEYQWKTEGRLNDWDWTEVQNFVLKGTETEGVPQANDTVFVPDGLTVQARSSDAASFSRVLSLGRIEPMGANAWVVFDVAEDATYAGAFTAWNGYVAPSRNKGGFIKKGVGTLNLSKSDRNNYTIIEVREGAVKLPATAATQFLDTIVVSNGATFFLNASGYTSMDGLFGEGLVTNTASASQILQITDASSESSVFGGVLSAHIDLVSEGGQLLLPGTNSNHATLTSRGNKGALTKGGYIGLEKIGATGESSSAGKGASLYFQSSGGGIQYLGTGETATKDLTVFNTVGTYPAFLDGGENGGLDLAGNLIFYNDYVLNFFFGGDNTNRCTFSGNVMSVAGGTSSGFISKYGSGTWRFKDVSQRWFTGGIGVLDGTLEFESIAEKGKKCSLGSAAAVYEDSYAGPVSSAPKADYAYVFGGTNATGAATGKGLFSYVGSDLALVTTRPAVVNGTGGFKADDGPIRFADVRAMNASGAKTLVLAGSGLTNEVQDVADGAGALSVLKEGSGTWYMSGSNTFSGTVTVDAGTLYLRDPSLYRWYRFNVQQLADASSSGNKVSIGFFGLFDKDGNAQDGDLPIGMNLLRLLPGEAGFATDASFSAASIDSGKHYGNLANMFVDQFGNQSLCYGTVADSSGTVLTPSPDDQTTWARFAMHLAEGANPVTSFDMAYVGYYHWAKGGRPATWSLEASSDGLRWDVLSETEEANNIWRRTGNFAYTYFWYYGEANATNGTAAVHTTGKAIAAFKANPLPAFENLGTVRVAAGATLKTDSTQKVTIRSLAIDANGMGTVENFAFAESGTVDFLNLGKAKSLPGTYVNCQGLGNLANWSVKADGKARPTWRITVRDGVVSVVKPGLLLIVR